MPLTRDVAISSPVEGTSLLLRKQPDLVPLLQETEKVPLFSHHDERREIQTLAPSLGTGIWQLQPDSDWTRVRLRLEGGHH